MSSHITDTARERASTAALPPDRQQRRRLALALLILAIIAISAVALYAISLIITAVLLLIFSALLAYLIYPLVQLLQRRLSLAPAIVVAYLLLASALAAGMFIVTSSLIQQSFSLVQAIQFLLSPAGEARLQPLFVMLQKLDISQNQITGFKNQLLSQVMSALSELIPFLSGFFGNVIDILIAITMSVYFVIDGPRIIRWFSCKTPLSQRGRINFLLHALDQSLGGYFRGSLVLALFGALATGIGLALLHVPYAALLGALFFLLYFVPVMGPYLIEALCILAALPLGWVMMLIVALYMTFLQGIVIGQILTPRVFNKSVGVHPIVALFALFAGAELFGLLGGFFAIPVAGVLQHIIVALWHRWQAEHPEEFPPEEQSLRQ